jgi:MFS family permease
MTEAISARLQSTARKANRRAWYVLAVLALATLCGVVDRQILLLVVDPLKHDLGLKDLQIGEILGLGPALFAGLAGMPLAWLADHYDRRAVLVACILLWSALTAACGLTSTFIQLFACTIVVAVGEAALGPIVYALIPDFFSGERRQTANLIYYAVVTVGGGLGLVFCGGVIKFIEHAKTTFAPGLVGYATWRLSFVAVGAIGVFVAGAAALIGAARPPHKQGAAPESTTALLPYLRVHGWTLLGLCSAWGFTALGLGSLLGWLPVAVGRALRIPAPAVGVGLGIALSAGSAVGIVLAFVGMPFWRRISASAPALRALQITGSFAVIPAMLLGFVQSPWQVYLLAGSQIAMFTAGAGLAPSMFQDITPVTVRARVLAISSLCYAVVAASGPVLAGALSDLFAGSDRGLLWSLIGVSASSLALAVLAYQLTLPAFDRTVARLQSNLAPAT